MKINAILLLLTLLSACSTSDRLIGENCRQSLMTDSNALSASLSEDLQQLTSPALNGRKTNTQGAELTRDYLQQRFAQLGLRGWQGQYQHRFDYVHGFSNQQGINLAVEIPADASVRNPPWRLLLAHYDHLGGRASKARPDGRYFPGADDNASGVAALLAVAETLSRQQLPANVLLVFTDAEEPGLFGSKALVKQLQTADLLDRVELVINLDMVGRPDKHRRIYIEGLQSLERQKGNQVLQALQQHYDTTGLCARVGHPRGMGRGSFVTDRIDWLRASDHYPFHQQDLPWLFLTTGDHPHYHTPEDKPAQIDLNNLNRIVALADILMTLPQPHQNQTLQHQEIKHLQTDG